MNDLAKNSLVAIAHYDEIALKKKNRDFFEKVLINNIARALPNYFVKRKWGYIEISAQNNKGDFDEIEICHTLNKTPGVAHFGVGVKMKRNKNSNEIDSLTFEAIKCAQRFKNGNWTSFRVTAKRTDKSFTHTSTEIERIVGEAIFESYNKKRSVNLRNAELEIILEIRHDALMVYAKIPGMGGLPVGSSGKAVLLLSGGFDSPVAGYLMTKRGIRIHAVHFHGMPHTSEESIQKVRDLSKILAEYSGNVKLILISVVPAMRAIAVKGKQTKLRVVLLRRFMNRVAEHIAFNIKAGALITGESVGQVASQTLENMRMTSEHLTLPILRPLCAFNKQEILNMARKIGTHDISVLPHDDTCSMFMPKQPETRAKPQEVYEALKTYNEDALVEDALQNMEIEIIKPDNNKL